MKAPEKKLDVASVKELVDQHLMSGGVDVKAVDGLVLLLKNLSAAELYSLAMTATKAEDGKQGESTMLHEIARLGQLELLEAIVDGGGFHGDHDGEDADLNLNLETAAYGEGVYPIHLCAQRFGALKFNGDKDHDTAVMAELDKLGKMFSIFAAGGKDNIVTNFLYNAKRKAGFVADGVAKVVDGGKAVAEKVSEYIPQGVFDALSGVAQYAANMMPVEVRLPEMPEIGLLSVELAAILDTASTYGTYVTDLVAGTKEQIDKNDTRIANPEFRSKTLVNSADLAQKYQVFLNIVRNGSYQEVGVALFWLYKELKDNKEDLVTKEFWDVVAVNAAQNRRDPYAVILLLGEISSIKLDEKNNALSFDDKVDMACKVALEACKVGNTALADEVLKYYAVRSTTFKDAIKTNKIWLSLEQTLIQDVKFLNELDTAVVTALKGANTVKDDDFGSFINVGAEERGLKDIWEECKNRGISIRMLAGYVSKDNKYTMLHAAAKLGLDDMVLELVQNGADLNAVDSESHTAFHYAASAGKTVGESNSELRARYANILCLLVYGGYYSEISNVGHNISKRVGAQIGQSVRDITGAAVRRPTAEQANLSREKAAIVIAAEWMPADLFNNFVLYYSEQRWPEMFADEQFVKDLTVAAGENKPQSWGEYANKLLAGFVGAKFSAGDIKQDVENSLTNAKASLEARKNLPKTYGQQVAELAAGLVEVVTIGAEAVVGLAVTPTSGGAKEEQPKQPKKKLTVEESSFLGRTLERDDFDLIVTAVLAEMLEGSANSKFYPNIVKLYNGEFTINEFMLQKEKLLFPGQQDTFVELVFKNARAKELMTKSQKERKPLVAQTRLDWDKIVLPVLQAIWEKDSGDIKAQYKAKEDIANLKKEYPSMKSTAVFVEANKENVFFNTEQKINNFNKVLLEQLDKVNAEEKPKVEPKVGGSEPTPTTQPTPTKASQITAGFAGLFTVITLGGVVIKVVEPYFIRAVHEHGNWGLAAVSGGAFVGTIATVLSTYKSPPLGVVVSALSTAASLYFGNNSENEKLIIGIGGAVAFVTSCVATYCMNDKQPAVEHGK